MSIENSKGLFIALEGIDGSGKSTQIRLLAEYFRSCGSEVYVTMEPTASPFGKLLRQVLTGELKTDPRVAGPMFVADRMDHLLGETDGLVRRIRRGEHVITDRYYFSSYAYQSVDLPMDWVIAANSLCADILRPDLTVFLDIDADTAMERITKNRDHTEIFEVRDRLLQTRENYFRAFDRLKTEERIAVVDGTRSQEEIAEEIQSLCRALLEGRQEDGRN